ncbi:MAG TPA: FAD-dependent oxidoreductase, partial [Cyclobacteriaceae bacterium]|nr:FAD-dependent oxidoreductase [Cyclobacteriaceae bacterium]
TLLDTPYPVIIKNFGENNARLVAHGADQAVAHIRENIARYHIDCGFESCNAFLFAQNEKQNNELQEIIEGCKTVELPVTEDTLSPVPIPFTRVLRVAGQAKFHPLRYIEALAKEFIATGGVIIENERVTGVSEKSHILNVETERKMFQCGQLIYATHVPPGINLIHLRYTPLRSYALAATLADDHYPQHLAYDLHDPYHYYRTQKIDGIHYLIAGGEDHKTGEDVNTEARFNALEAHTRKYFNVKEVTHRWSSQYYETTDGLPYIGILPGNSGRILVATGFGGNGMTYGTLSAFVLKSILFSEENPLISLFAPSRIKPIAGFKNFVAHNTNVLKEVVSKFFSSGPEQSFADIAPTEGKVMEVDGKKIGVYKDEQGSVHAVHAACTHMGCTVTWNQTEKSWDCPCHGARYSVDGTVLNGPADRSLEYINLQAMADKE